ncbi:unnamed protein product [Heterobilharzia americana]|nr:unnamed protein product [Heterobilharzia americana]
MSREDEERVVCKCLCFYLIDTTVKSVETDKCIQEEEKFLISKAKALSNFLFLKDDIYTIDTVKLYDKIAITNQPLTIEHDLNHQQILAKFQTESETIKAYFKNHAKQMNRQALLTVLEKVIDPLE